MALTPIKNGFLGLNRGSMWPQEWDIWLSAILFMIISYFYMKPLYLLPKSPKSNLKCQLSIEVKKEKFSAFWHFLRSRNLQSLKNKIYFIFYIIIIMNMHRNIKMADFWLKSAFLATFPSNSVGLKLTLKVIVLENLIQIIKCPILGVTMKLLIASRIHD